MFVESNVARCNDYKRKVTASKNLPYPRRLKFLPMIFFLARDCAFYSFDEKVWTSLITFRLEEVSVVIMLDN